MELLVVIAVIGILAALLLPVLSSAKSKARRTTCANNLHEINVGLRMYCDDAADKAPPSPYKVNAYVLDFISYQNDFIAVPTMKFRGSLTAIFM